MNNKKKILCKNILKYSNCKYDSRCMYSHTLFDQNIDHSRQCIYNLIDGITSYININDPEIYNDLVILSKLCINCANKNCQGGLNCKYGACSTKYNICINDLNYKVCTNTVCSKVHISKLLKLTVPKHLTFNFDDVNIPTKIKISHDYFSHIYSSDSEIDLNDDKPQYILNSLYDDIYSTDEECTMSIFNSKK